MNSFLTIRTARRADAAALQSLYRQLIGSGANMQTDGLGWGFLARAGKQVSKLKNIDKLFEGRHFDREVIVLCVRWYLRYKLSLRDLEGVRHFLSDLVSWRDEKTQAIPNGCIG